MLTSAVTNSSNGPNRKFGNRLNSEGHISLPSFDSPKSSKNSKLKQNQQNCSADKSMRR